MQKARSSGRKKWLLRGLLLVIVVSLLFPFRGTVARVFGVIQQPFAAVGTWAHRVLAPIDPNEREEIEGVIRQRDQYAIEYAELERLRLENEELRAQIGYFERAGYASVSARIIIRSVDGGTSGFVIDRGEEDGVSVGDPVIVGEGVLAGKVSHVGPATATITSVSDSAFATAASILNEQRTIGIVEGKQGGLLELRFIPHDEQIEIDDLIVTSGLEEQVPSGIVIGVINAVEGTPTDPFITAIVQPIADLSRSAIVTVVKTAGL